MPKITYVQFDGDRSELEIACGLSVMQGAVNNGLQGVIAECGGACSCATCHVYVDATWVNRLPAKGGDEESMLDAVCDLQPNSRLSCQIKVTEDLDGLIVRMPAKQV